MAYAYDHTVQKTSGAGAPFCPVEIRLETIRKSPGFTALGGVSQTVRVTTDAAGYFTTPLVANFGGSGPISAPQGSYYTVIERLSTLDRRDEDRVWQVRIDGAVLPPGQYLGVDLPIPLAQFRLTLGTMPTPAALDAHIADIGDPHAAAGYLKSAALIDDWDCRLDVSQGWAGAYLLNAAVWTAYPGGAGYDIVLPMVAGQGCSVAIEGTAMDEPAIIAFDVASMVAGSPIRWFGSGGLTTPLAMTMVSTAGIVGDYRAFSARRSRTIQADEIVGGLITLRVFFTTGDAGYGVTARGLAAGILAGFYFEAERRRAHYGS